MFQRIFNLTNLTLLVALSLSSVAAYYSIIGLTAIFAGAVIPIIIMGSILEVGKITTTVWLRKYWKRAGWAIKLYLVPAVVALALLTSMGIFGFLSKAHMEQGVTSGEAQSKVAIFDEKIKTAKDNIDANRKALKQMDEAVDQVMGRSTSETGADKAVAVRRSQQKERARLLAEIQEEQKTVSRLSEERAPLASELRKVEAEVGPIKYIAALIYGDNADSNMLEAAVRWVIILLVAVFDPLAIALVLAANQSKVWDKEVPGEENKEVEPVEPIENNVESEDDSRLVQEANDLINDIEKPEFDVDSIEIPEPEVVVPVKEKTLIEQHPYLKEKFHHFTDLVPMVYKPEVKEEVIEEPKIEIPDVERPGDYLVTPEEIETEGVTEVKEEKAEPFIELPGGYVDYEGKHMSKEALKSLQPELFMLKADSDTQISSNFGTKFPDVASKGDIFVRVDVLPNRVFKFDSSKWIEINKNQSDAYLFDEKYIQYLVSKIERGEYDPELLSEQEKQQIEAYLNNQ